MHKFIKKIIKNSKSKINFALAHTTSKFHSQAFIFGVILLIIAYISAFSVYNEGKRAQRNSQDMLSQFEQKQLIIEAGYLLPAISKTYPPEPSPETSPEPTLTPIASLQTYPTDTPSITPQTIPSKTPLSVSQSYAKKIENSPIAKLYIEEINLNISVLSEWSYDLLDISVCKFFGPDPNEPGNLVILGHNYLNGAHFGKLHLLKTGDIIEISDLTGRKKNYEIYEILTVKPNEIDKLETNEDISVTLVTCNPDGTLRLIVKAR